MVDSKINAKKYFLPVYAFFLVVTPTITFLMSGYLMAPVGENIGDYLPWERLPAIFALFGLIWPLTIVISPAFFLSVRLETRLSFFEAITTGGPLAGKAILAYILFTIAWIGPLIAFAAAMILHKRDVSMQTDDPKSFSWVDYLAAFI